MRRSIHWGCVDDPFMLLQLVGQRLPSLMCRGDPSRGLPGPVLRLREPAPDRRCRQSGIWSWDTGSQQVDPEVAELFEQGDDSGHGR